jgi:hypothetical protein
MFQIKCSDSHKNSDRGLRAIRQRLLVASSSLCQRPKYRNSSRPTRDGTAAVGIALRLVFLQMKNSDVHWPPPSAVSTHVQHQVSVPHWRRR